MGFLLMTKTGSFNPANYGLTVGDLLNVIVVGGGGGGCGFANDSPTGSRGTSGGSSSFGSYFTASGGGSGNTVGQSCGGTGIDSSDAGSYGGGGAGGWYPGLARTNQAGMSGLLSGITPGEIALLDSLAGCGGGCLPKVDNNYTAAGTVGTSGGGGGTASAGRVGGVGGEGGSGSRFDASHGYDNYGGGGGGAGYGAGGGGSATGGNGGNSGQVVYGAHKLTSTAAIPVTVGTGGAGSTRRPAGAGAPGCVAIFW